MANVKAVLAYAREKYQAGPEYLWRNFPHYAVLRHKDNSKWFAIIMNVARAKLGLPDEGETDIINVKAGPDLSALLRGAPGIFPAYHMNKDLWLSAALDGTAPDNELFKLIDRSYALTA